ncbi:MAG: PIN domain-containing protein [Candidatus Aenigmarchaeota archaeon]|nr:PIN domain-containing protein [Candidatus Aenigmarchaeota archaeon]
MTVVPDTNVLMSALIRDGATRRIIVASGLPFCYPEISPEDIRKHRELILRTSGMDAAAYEQMLAKLLEYVALVPTEGIREHLETAGSIMRGIDPNDAVFIAAALTSPPAVIWSDDRDFDGQSAVKVVKTRQLARVFSK